MSTGFTYYVHGHPRGFDYIGKVDEKNSFQDNYFGRIFSTEHNNGREKVDELRIEAVTLGNKQLFYYTLFLGKGILGQDTRPGYFAITVRMESYYKRAVNLFYILEAFFHGTWENLCLDQNKRFLHTDFRAIESQITSRFIELENLIGSLTNDDDIIQLKAPNSRSNHNCTRINICDADDDVVLHQIIKTGEVSISPDYPSEETRQVKKQYEAELKKTREQSAAQIALVSQEAKEQLNDKNSQIETLQQQLNKSSSNRRGLQQKLEKKEQELNDLKTKLQSSVNTFCRSLGLNSNPVKSIANTPMPPQAPQIPAYSATPQSKPTSTSRTKGNLQLYLLLASIGLIVCITCLFLFTLCRNGNEDIPPAETSVASESGQIDSTQYVTIDDSNLYIDVKEFSKNSTAKVGNNYTIRIKNAQGAEDKSDQWIVRYILNNNKPIILTKSANAWKFTPNAPGEYTLQLYKNDTIFKVRPITVQ